MLRACRRLLKPGGRTAFLTIVPAPGLSKGRHRRAVRLGPRAVAMTRPIEVLMAAAGFLEVEVIDATPEFLGVAQAWHREFARRETELREVLGKEYDDREADRRDMIAGVEEGLIRRVFVAGTAPGRVRAD